MTIDFAHEELLSLADATKALPPIDGRRPHTSTVWRWIRRGIRGVHLEHLRLGHRVCTSREALNRFAARLAEVDERPVEKTITTPKLRTAKRREHDIARASRELESAGI